MLKNVIMEHVSRLSVVLVFGVFLFFTTYSENSVVDTIMITLPGMLLLLGVVFAEKIFSKEMLNRVAGWALGILGGLLAAYLAQELLISQTSFSNEEAINRVISAVLVVFFAVLGSRITMLLSWNSHQPFATAASGMENLVISESQNYDRNANLLDSSVIIDGRIVEIAESGFIDGPYIVPSFVLREIQLICDSADPYKRSRGRRGLEMLAKLRESETIAIKITYQDYKDVHEVDAKLIRAAKDSNARLITNDFNLNKVAELQGIRVLNLNTLTNVLKTIVLPGEEVDINVVKEGRDEDQGIGYLVDGTMVVVENGKKYIGQKARVVVNSVIQTSAGKLVFTRFEKALGTFDSEDYKLATDDSKNDSKTGSGNGNGRRPRTRDQYANSSHHSRDDGGNRNREDRNREDRNRDDGGYRNREDRNREDGGNRNREDRNREDGGNRNREDRNREDRNRSYGEERKRERGASRARR